MTNTQTTRTSYYFRALVLVAALAMVASLLLTQVGKPAQAAFSGQNGKIAFVSERDGNSEIYTMNPDGSGQRNITNNPKQDNAPAWSPDGTKIAFESAREGDDEVFVMNADGSQPTNLSNSSLGEDLVPAWSPDGKKIVFASGRDGNLNETYVMNADGTGQTRLTLNKAFDDSGVFSPDGNKIAFASDRDGNGEIYVMNPDGTGQVNLTNLSTADDFDPDWGVSAAVTANTAPTVTNLSPAPNSTTSDRTPTIKATVTDKETNLQKSNITFFLDGLAKTGFTYSTSTDRLSFTPASSLKAGTHTAKVVATDPSGLRTTKSWSFTVK